MSIGSGGFFVEIAGSSSRTARCLPLNRCFSRRNGRKSRVPGLMILMPRTGHRALRLCGGLRCFVHVDCRHLVVDAVREQRVIFAMMMNLSAPLRPVVLDFRSVVRCFFNLRTTRNLLRFRGHGQGCRGWFGGCDRLVVGALCQRNVRAGFLRGVRRSDTVFRDSVRFRSRTCRRNCGINRTRVLVFLVMTIHVILRRVMVRFGRLFRLFGTFFRVRDEVRSLDHQVTTNFLQRGESYWPN